MNQLNTLKDIFRTAQMLEKDGHGIESIKLYSNILNMLGEKDPCNKIIKDIEEKYESYQDHFQKTGSEKVSPNQKKRQSLQKSIDKIVEIISAMRAARKPLLAKLHGSILPKLALGLRLKLKILADKIKKLEEKVEKLREQKKKIADK